MATRFVIENDDGRVLAGDRETMVLYWTDGKKNLIWDKQELVMWEQLRALKEDPNNYDLLKNATVGPF